MNFKRIFFLLIYLFPLLTMGQNLSQHNWYFGNSANAIRFNRSTNKPFIVTNKKIPFGTGGSAVATDASNAELLFYTDGANIYDATNTLMDAANPGTSGAGLLANTSANQPVVICPVPEDSTKYLVFANTANYTAGGTITVSVVDMTAFGNAASPAPPLGKVIAKNLATGLTGRSEGMVVVPHSNGKDYWLITHQNGTTNFSASLVTKTSFNSAGAGSFSFTSGTIANGLGYNMSVANFAYNARKKLLAASAQDTNTDAILLKFDDGSGGSPGAITFDRYIYNSGTPTVNPQSIYDIEWDSKGQYLYVSRVGETGINADVLQYDYANPTNSLASVLKAPEYRSWGLQIAPDSIIYHIYQAVNGGPFLVEKFTKTDTVAAGVIETALPFGAIDFKGTQFPAFSPKPRIILTLTFLPTTACQNLNTTFFPNVIPNADSLHWSFGDTVAVYNEWSPVHKFKTAGTFPVTLTAYYRGDSTVFTQSITVNAFDLRLTLPTDTTACHDEFPTPYGTKTRFTDSFRVKVKAAGTGAGSATFTWSDGETGNTVWPLKPGYFFVKTAPDANGCVASAGVNVKEYGLQDQRANIWYFGKDAGIDFNPLFATPPATKPTALNDSNMDAPAGCAIVCDRNGQVIFYTDGNTVYDKTKLPIATGLGGDPSSSQSSLIVPVPGDETLYYIFTTESVNNPSPTNQLRYSLFDLKMPPNGAVINTGVLLFSKTTERITASTDWLIAHELGNNTFRAYRITAAGLGDPVYSAIGSDHSFGVVENGQGYMKLGPNNTLAVALSTPGVNNLIELFHLNDSTGVLSYYRKISLSNTSGQVYGIEFSPGGKKVFASVSGTASSDIYEYSIDTLGHTKLMRDSVFNVQIGALQYAPDSKIYVAINGSTMLGTITPVDDITVKSGIDMGTGFALASGTNSWMGLPNFVQHVSNGFGGPGFTFTGICLGDSTRFSGVATDAIDKFQWFFGDGSGSSKASPTHLYSAAGTYTVTMRLTNRCGLNVTIIHQVKINAPPARPTLSPANVICTSALQLHANTPSTGVFRYYWSTGDTTESIFVSKPTFLSVTNIDKATGCYTTANGVVVDGRPQVSLGADQTVCQNTAVAALDAQNAGDSYAWTLNGVANGNTSQFQGVSTATAGTYKYGVTITDPITGCFVSANQTYTVIQSPSFTISGTNPTTCLSTDGSITVNSISVPHLYSYFITGPGGFNKQGTDQVAASVTFTGPPDVIGAGTYSVIITDQVSGCTISDTKGLSNSSFAANPSPSSNCDPPIVKISNNAGAAFFPMNYTATNSVTGQTVTGTINTQTASFNIQLPSQGGGTSNGYTIQINATGGCIVTASYTSNTTATTALAFQFDPCLNPAKLNETSGATNVTWTGPGIAGSFVGNPLTVTTQGTSTYQVTAMSAGCPVTGSTTIDYNGSITPSFTYDQCVDQAVFIASPVNANYNYRWYQTGAATQPTYLGQQIAPPVTIPFSASLALEIFDTQNGCTVKMNPAQAVQIFGKITASIPPILACDNGQPFTLTATTNAPTPIYEWFLNNAIISGAASSTVQQTSDGLYKVRITQGVCKDSATQQITKAPIPMGLLKLMYQICSDPDNHVDSTKYAILRPGTFSAYNWFHLVGSTYQPLGVTDMNYQANDPGRYRVDLTDANGCANSDFTDVINDCEPIIAGPNVFRPASSHTDNTVFQLFTFYIKNFEIIVYNRWGEAVYESKDDKFKWNGGYNNNLSQPLPGGTYTYLVRYVSTFHPERGVLEQRGGVVLLR